MNRLILSSGDLAQTVYGVWLKVDYQTLDGLVVGSVAGGPYKGAFRIVAVTEIVARVRAPQKGCWVR